MGAVKKAMLEELWKEQKEEEEEREKTCRSQHGKSCGR